MSEIEIAFTDEKAPLTDCFESARVMEPEQREIARELTSQALAGGITTVGGLLDHLDQVGLEGRRELVDKARVATGRPTIAQQEAQDYLRLNAGLRGAEREIDLATMRELPTAEEVAAMEREEEPAGSGTPSARRNVGGKRRSLAASLRHGERLTLRPCPGHRKRSRDTGHDSRGGHRA